MFFEQQLDEDEKPYVYLNVNDMPEFDDKELEKFKCFQVTTYDLLKKINDQEAWDVVFKSVNSFFKTLDKNDCSLIAKMFLNAHFDIIQYLRIENQLDDNFAKNIDTLTEILSRSIGILDEEIKLVPKLIEFVNNELTVGDFSGVGKRPEDTPEMTFYKKDVVLLTSIVVLCKMLSPIFGIIINYCSKLIDNELKVFHCYIILKDILNMRYRTIYDKLCNYLKNIIEPTIKIDIILLAFNANSIDAEINKSLAYLLIRRFITVDIYTSDGNLMTYIMSCTKSSINTMNTNTSRKNAVKEKRDPEEIRGDEGNLSRLENESRNSKTPADVPVIIKVTAEYIIMHMRNMLTVEERMIYDNTVDFYSHNHVIPTKFNKYLLAIYFGNELYGASSINFLNIAQYNKLIAMLQIQLYKLGLIDLILLASSIKTDGMKTNLSYIDQTILMNWHTFSEYKMCALAYPHNCNDLTWDTIMPSLANFIVNNNFVYNTSDEIWNLLQLENYNNKIVNNTQFIFKDLYKLIMHCISREEGLDADQQNIITL